MGNGRVRGRWAGTEAEPLGCHLQTVPHLGTPSLHCSGKGKQWWWGICGPSWAFLWVGRGGLNLSGKFGLTAQNSALPSFQAERNLSSQPGTWWEKGSLNYPSNMSSHWLRFPGAKCFGVSSYFILSILLRGWYSDYPHFTEMEDQGGSSLLPEIWWPVSDHLGDSSLFQDPLPTPLHLIVSPQVPSSTSLL